MWFCLLYRLNGIIFHRFFTLGGGQDHGAVYSGMGGSICGLAGNGFRDPRKLLMPTYEAIAELWRPKEEMKHGLMAVVGLIASAGFTGIYCCLVDRKNVSMGLLYGILFGVVVGVGMGYGTYSLQAIPYNLAMSWLLAAIAEYAVGGLIVGAILSCGKTDS